MTHSDYLVFVDESGDHSLVSIDPNYPVFVLSFCLIKKEAYIRDICPAIKELKIDYFGHDAVVFHEQAIRKGNAPFSHLGKDGTKQLMERISRIIADADFKLFAMVIDKSRLNARYNHPAHPYHMAMQLGLERIRNFLASRGQDQLSTHLICESRGAKEDRELELAFRRVCDGENIHRAHYAFELVMVDKKANCEGLQLADLTARPIGVSVLRPEQANRAREILEAKFATNRHGEKSGVGLKIFPAP